MRDQCGRFRMYDRWNHQDGFWTFVSTSTVNSSTEASTWKIGNGAVGTDHGNGFSFSTDRCFVLSFDSFNTSSIWTTGVGDYNSINITLSDDGTIPAGTSEGRTIAVQFGYPLNGAITLDFSRWVFNISSTLSSSTIPVQIFVAYGQNSSSLNFEDSAWFHQDLPQVRAFIPKSQLLNPIISFNQTSTWYAEACTAAQDVSSSCTSEISFTIDPLARYVTSTEGQLAQQFSGNPNNFDSSTVSSTLGKNPYSCTGNILTLSWANCWNWGIYSLANILFNPSEGVNGYLQSSITGLEQQPPFAGVFETLNDIKGQTGNPSSTQNLNYTLSLGDGTYVSSTYTFAFLTSSTMSKAITPQGKNFLFSLEDAMFDLLSLGVTFYVPWHWWHRKNSPVTKTT